jgi:high affinity sulfate transporter 1
VVRIIKQSFTNLEAARSRLLPMVPGLADLLRYRRSDLSHDVVAGLAVAAVTVPVGIANAQLAGLPPATGLYASILPLVVYAVFGTSRQLIVGSSAAASAVVASAIAPLAGGDPALYLALSMMLALFVGLLCIAASFLRLGAIADFLSKPILVGFMNGLSISIVLSQFGPLFGIPIASSGFFPRALEFVRSLSLTHLPTLAVGILSLAVLVASGRYLRRVPAALLAMLVAGVAAWLFSLEQTGVSMIGKVPAGLPMLSLPRVPLHHLPVLLAEAAGLALVSFSSMMLVARSFADKNRYDVDADREIAALGAANIAAAMSQSFVVTGSGARTAVAESAGGRTQVAGLVAAAVLVPVLLFVTGPLQFVPTVALAAILITTGLSLINWEDLRAIYRIDSQEFWLAMIATVGVLLFGAIQAILFVVVLALLRFVRLTARPNVEILGELAGNAGYQSIERHPAAASPPGLVLFRYNGPIVFFSAPHFKKAVRRAAADAGPDLKWFVIDLLPVSMIDATGLFAIRDEFDALRSRGIVVAAAGRDTEWADRAARRDLSGVLTGIRFFPTLRLAEITYRAETQA